MRIVTLIENTACREDLASEHGLSLYIEAAGRRILFDAGQSGAFADNAQKLGVDLSRVELAMLSHGHYDHGGGLTRFLEENEAAPVYLHPDCFTPHYNGTEKYIGLDPELRRSGRLIFAGDRHVIAPGLEVRTCGGLSGSFPGDSAGLLALEEGRLVPDAFRHEQVLLIREGDRCFCISGCSHRGVVNIVRWFAPDVLVGGFHFMKLDPEGAGRKKLEAAAAALLEQRTVYYTGHCTGIAQYAFLKQRMGDRLHSLSAGTEIVIE